RLAECRWRPGALPAGEFQTTRVCCSSDCRSCSDEIGEGTLCPETNAVGNPQSETLSKQPGPMLRTIPAKKQAQEHSRPTQFSGADNPQGWLHSLSTASCL